jgi:type IV secretion system protein VirB6
MSPQCEQAVAEVGNGIAASLMGVDCLAGEMTQAGFARLFGSEGALIPALTILLTLFIAFFAIALITGRTRISIRALIPRIVTLGMVLTLATSWIAWQSLVWNLAAGAPDQVATIILGGDGSATQVFAQKIEIVFGAIQEATSQQGQPQPEQVTTFSPQGLLWMGATLMLLGTLGVLVTAKIALAVLMAVGPVFVAMVLFPGTRGLFTGWLKALTMLAITPLFAVLGGTLMLELAVPVLSGLAPVPGQIDPRAAMAFFMIGAVHVALMVLMLKVAGTMVSGWRVFGLVGTDQRAGRDPAPANAAALIVAEQRQAQAAQTAAPAPRRLAIAGVTASVAANDTASGGTALLTTRETRLVAAGAGSPGAPLASAPSRARGIGSRFRSPPSRSTEKMK